jgi:hypothetical protein
VLQHGDILAFAEQRAQPAVTQLAVSDSARAVDSFSDLRLGVCTPPLKLGYVVGLEVADVGGWPRLLPLSPTDGTKVLHREDCLKEG